MPNTNIFYHFIREMSIGLKKYFCFSVKFNILVHYAYFNHQIRHYLCLFFILALQSTTIQIVFVNYIHKSPAQKRAFCTFALLALNLKTNSIFPFLIIYFFCTKIAIFPKLARFVFNCYNLSTQKNRKESTMKTPTVLCSCSEKCRFSSNCQMTGTVAREKVFAEGLEINYFLFECKIGFDNEYGIESAKPLYSIALLSADTHEERKLCCISSDKHEAKMILCKLKENSVTPFEAETVFSELTATEQ